MNTMNLLKRIRRLEDQQLATTAGGSLAALDNYVSLSVNGGAAVHFQTQTNAQEVTIAAVALPVKYSGIFAYGASVGCASDTTAKTVRHKLVAIPFASPATPTFSDGTAAAGCFFGSSVGSDADAAHRNKFAQVLNADAGGASAVGVLYSGAAVISTNPNAIVVGDTGATPTLAGLLAGSAIDFSFGSFLAKSTAPKVPFTLSTPMVPQILVLGLVLANTNGGDVVTYQTVDLWLQEQPLP